MPRIDSGASPSPLTLRPADEQIGWSDLVGHRRYRFDSTGAAPGLIEAFLEGAGLHTTHGDPATLDLHVLRFDAFLVLLMQTPRIKVDDPSTHIRIRCERTAEWQQERFLFLFVNRGSISVEGDTPHWSSFGGGMCLIFPGRTPVDINITEPGEGILLSATQSELDPIALTPDTVGDVDPRSSVFRAAYAFLHASTMSPLTPQTDEAEGDATALRVMIREIARGITKAATASSKSLGLFYRAQRIIDQRAHDPDFDIDTLAAQCLVSRRTLDRTYSNQGLRTAQELRRARARIALPLVTSDTPPPARDIAAASGFRSVDSLSRALKEAYGSQLASADGSLRSER